MGTHYYTIQILKGKSEIPLSDLKLPFIDMEATQSETGFADSRYDRFLYHSTCREVVYRVLRDSTRNAKTSGKHFSIGILARGEMHHKIATIMAEFPGAENTLSRYFKKIFGVTMQISTGDNDSNRRVAIQYRKSYQSSEVVTEYFDKNIVLKFTWKDVEKFNYFGIMISSILALLREPVIIRGVLSRRYRTVDSLVKALMEIAWARANRKDDSYFCTSLVSHIGATLEEIKGRVKNCLIQTNTDGSDARSIVQLAEYIKMHDYCQNLAGLSNEYGPSDLMYHAPGSIHKKFLESCTKSTMSVFRNFVDSEYYGLRLPNKMLPYLENL